MTMSGYRNGVIFLVMVAATSTTHADILNRAPVTATPPDKGIFWSGHSLTDPPIPGFVAEISASLGQPVRWNRHSMAGASLEARTRGRPPNLDGWDGYQQGFNRDSDDMDVISELQVPRTIGDSRYAVMVITEVHDFLWSLLRGDTVRLLRHYHERFIEGNPAGQTFFYQSWLGIHDMQNPQPWIAYERAASPVWQCIANRINVSLEAEGRDDRLAFLPASAALVELVERATTGNGIAGISDPETSTTMKGLFRDDVHLTPLGAYYIALVSYAFIEKAPPIGAWAPPDISGMQAAALQKLAWEFASEYRAGNTPLSLEACRELLRESFAADYWQYIFDGYRDSNEPWHTAIYKRLTNTGKRLRNTLIWQQSFAEDAPENPFRFDQSTDASYWHSPP